jgi:hypothetical protein
MGVGRTGFRKSSARLSSVIDSLEADGFEWYWLQHGFPLREQRQVSEINYWRVIDDLNNENVSRAIVFSRSAIKNFEWHAA